LRGGGESTTLNIGYGHGYSVKEVIQEAKVITNKDFKILKEPRRNGDPSILIASGTNAKKELNLVFNFESLQSIIKTLV